ncbi:MAG: hypothetical protein ACREDI_08340 [Roseiarcus sp.]
MRRLVLVVVSLGAFVLLAKTPSYPVDAAIGAAGLPKAIVGVAIALIVLLPEGLAAMDSALPNRLQNSINLALGSAIASIGLTIPTVALISLVLNRQIALGVSQTDMTLLILTLYIAVLTLGAGRTTALQGAVHLVILAAFMLYVGRAVDHARRRMGALSSMARIAAWRAVGCFTQ